MDFFSGVRKEEKGKWVEREREKGKGKLQWGGDRKLDWWGGEWGGLSWDMKVGEKH